MGSEVAARLEAIGADRAQWPAAAREEAQRLDARAASLASMLSAAQAAADHEAAAARAAQRQQVHSFLLPPSGSFQARQRVLLRPDEPAATSALWLSRCSGRPRYVIRRGRSRHMCCRERSCIGRFPGSPVRR